MLSKLINIYKKGGIQRVFYVFQNLKRQFFSPIYMTILELIKKPEDKIVFCNFAGKGYGGYPKSICDELIKRNIKAELIWLSNGKCEVPETVKTVDINSYAALRELATAKIWVDNCRKSRFIRKSNKQFYIQTWHGGGPCLKMIEGDAEAYLSKAYIKDAKNDTKMADLFISDCKWQNDTYKRAFWYNGEILNCGTPSNDIFYRSWDATKAKVFDYFGLDTANHIILYAPTFRNDHATSHYDLDFDRVIKNCEKKFGGKWIVFFRLHPTIADSIIESKFSSNILNATMYPQMDELLVASDILITDFSASMFEAFRWKKITFLYASDYEDYIRHERPLYFELMELPASFSKDNNELSNNISCFSKDLYVSKCIAFNKEIGYFTGGNSVNIITDRIESEINRM